MCHEWWSRREERREDRVDRELRHLLDEERERPERLPVLEHEPDETAEPDRAPLESVTR